MKGAHSTLALFAVLFLAAPPVHHAEDARADTSKVCSELEGHNVRTSTLTLNDDRKIHRLGFGTGDDMKPGAETYGAVYQALNVGYRQIDTAQIHGNEKDVGMAVRNSGIPRKEIFVTSKLWPDYKHDMSLIINHGNADKSPLGYQVTLAKVMWSLNVTGLDYFDMFLMNAPLDPTYRIGAWLALQDLVADGKLRSIGVSNYGRHHIEELVKDERVKILPAVNQVEVHPWMQRRDLVRYCSSHGIVMQAHSPLAKARMLTDKALIQVASEVQRTPAQVLIRWSLQSGFIPIPKSLMPSRIKENSKVFDFELDGDQMIRLNDLESGMAVAWDPSDEP